ncbi:MAG: ferredoxin-thioredoxin reductase catalytic domain-containing protein [Candidatus Helarchaeota archaeon]
MVSKEDFRKLIQQNAESNGWILPEDKEWLEGLLDGLFINKQRYGYPACPCRLAEGDFNKDKDIICPCDYADPNIKEFGHCYCGLFYDPNFFKDKKKFEKIPERRNS